MVNAIMVNVIMLIVIMLSVVASKYQPIEGSSEKGKQIQIFGRK